MKKYLLILAVIIFFALGAWFFLRGSDSPIVDLVENSLPFGSGEGLIVPEPTEEAEEEPSPSESAEGFSSETHMAESRLFRISEAPVAGFVVLAQGTSTVVRYVDRATGHISDTNLDKQTKVKVTNQTLPKIYQAHFRSDGSSVLLRSLDDTESVENVALALTPPKSTSTSTEPLYTIAATNLRGDIDSVIPGAGNLLFYVLRDSSSIMSSTFTGTGSKTLFKSGFNNWRLSLNGVNVLVTTKANSDIAGYAYTLNAAGGNLSKVLGPLKGLVANANPRGNQVLYSYVESGRIKLSVKNLQNNTSMEISPTTIAEKCAWSTKTPTNFFCAAPIVSAEGEALNNWYLGRTHFSDYVWRFDTDSEIGQLIAEPITDFGVDLDMYALQLSPSENYLVFMNKRDLSLWSLTLQ